MILGHSDYHWAHEPMYYCVKQEKNCEWFGDRAQKTLQGLKIGDLAEIKKEILVELLEQIMRSTTNWEFRRDHVVEYVHPTQKPVEMAARAIRNSSDKGEIVLDLFGGSGSALMACEMIKRRAFLMEFDEKYCDVIIKRWEDRTGGKVVIE